MKQLRQYQTDAINKLAYKSTLGKKRICFQLATGGGKTVTFAGLVHRYLTRQPDKRVVILVHREELLKQARRTLYDWYGIVAVSVMAGQNHLPDAQVYVCMAETANNRLKRNPNYFGNVGLCIVDEAHLGSFRKLLLHFPCLTIGFTATPISASKKSPLKEIYEDIVTCIDIPELIAEGSLCPNITYHVKNIDRKTLSVSKGEFDDKAMGAAYSKPKQVHNTVDAYARHIAGKKTLVFNCNVEHSKLVCEAFVSAGLPARHLDANSSDRASVVEWFANTPNAILCNVGILTTGFDEPSVEAIIMNKATLSLPLWLQCTGRGSRIHPGKPHFTILDLGGNALSHGDWSASRDWEDLFNNPDKPSDGKGVAAIRECESCEAIIPASARECKYCGHVREIVVNYDGDPLVLELLTNSTLSVSDVVEKNTEAGHNDYAALHKIKALLVIEAKRKGIRKLNDDSANKLATLYQSKVKEWCAAKKKRYSEWHKTTTAEWFMAELKRVFNYEPAQVLATA